MTTTRQALVAKCEAEGRLARSAGAARNSCPYGDRETIARDAWLEGYRDEKQLQFATAYGPQGGIQQ